MYADIRNQNLYAGSISTVFSTLILIVGHTSSVPVNICEALIVACAYGIAATESEKRHRSQSAFWLNLILLPTLLYGPALALPGLRPHVGVLWLTGVLTYSVRFGRSPLLRLGEPIFGCLTIWLVDAWVEMGAPWTSAVGSP